MIFPTSQELHELVQLLRPAVHQLNLDQLRDRIATEAMGRLMLDWFLAHSEFAHATEAQEMESLCLQAYRFADAMLAARGVKQ